MLLFFFFLSLIPVGLFLCFLIIFIRQPKRRILDFIYALLIFGLMGYSYTEMVLADNIIMLYGRGPVQEIYWREAGYTPAPISDLQLIYASHLAIVLFLCFLAGLLCFGIYVNNLANEHKLRSGWLWKLTAFIFSFKKNNF